MVTHRAHRHRRKIGHSRQAVGFFVRFPKTGALKIFRNFSKTKPKPTVIPLL